MVRRAIEKYFYKKMNFPFLVDDIFPGDQWKLHPDWVYCEYNYGGAEDQKSDNPEKNMRHFLERLADERSSVNWDISRSV